jgi:DNA-binding HxlR family transcriptional regulator
MDNMGGFCVENKCPIESTISLINGKWKILILKELSQGPVRYGQIGNNIPTISAKVLTHQLREMIDDGLVVRKVFAEVPPRVEYSLGEMGKSLFTVFTELRRWGLSEDKVHSIQCAYCKKCQPIWQAK